MSNPMTNPCYIPPSSEVGDLILVHHRIEPGESVEFAIEDVSDQWRDAERFYPKSLVFVGEGDLWLSEKSYADPGLPLVRAAIPLETYRPSCPNTIGWPALKRRFSILIEHRGMGKPGHLVLRLGGTFLFPHPEFPPHFGGSSL